MKKIYSLKNKPLLFVIPALLLLSYLGSLGCNHIEPDITLTYNKNYRLIIPQTTSLPPINVDGSISDTAWNNDAFTLNLIDANENPGAEMRGVADASNIYLYFDMDESDFSNTDTIAIAFNPSSVPSDYHLLLIKPCELGISTCQGIALPTLINSKINYFTGVESGGTVTWTDVPGVAGVTANTTVSGTTRWMVEVSIPRGAPFNFPPTKYFGLYTNIIPTDGFSDSAQFTWPFVNNAGTNLIFGNVTNIPPVSVWGNATLSTKIGNGVRISSSDISTNHSPSEISWNELNTFYADVHNNTLNSGTLTSANAVRATFKWANFGLPGYNSFQNIPAVTGNPTSYRNIGATNSETYSINWQSSIADQPFYQANPHWCLKVELDSTDPNTIFFTRSAQRNMSMVETSSPFDRKATLGTDGYRLPKGSNQHEIILEEKFYNTNPKFKWKSSIQGAKKIANSKYRVKINPERKAILDFSILPPNVAIPNVKLKVMQGSFTSVSVKSGQLITIVSEGRISNIDTLPDVSVAGPGGTVLNNTEGTRYLFTTSDSKYVRVGALVGSWDKFKKSSFLIGSASSYKVPKGTVKLSLAINRKIGTKLNKTRTGYKVRVIVSDRKDYYVTGKLSPNNRVILGANLPTVVYRGKRKTGRTITINKKTFKVYVPIGSFGFIVKGKKR